MHDHTRARLARLLLPLALALATTGVQAAQQQDMQPIGNRFEIDRTEVTIGEFRRFVAATGTVTQAERTGGGSTYEGG